MYSENGIHFQTKILLKCFKRTEKVPNKIIFCSSQKQKERVSTVAAAHGIRKQSSTSGVRGGTENT